MQVTDPYFFETPAKFRAWLRKNHAKASELWVGYRRKDSGRKSITWPESVDEALCHGWIDGIRKRIDAESYAIRFTPRKPTSIWSAVNLGRVQVLIAEGRMQPAGMKAFEARREDRTAIYAFERKTAPELTPEETKTFRANAKAWTFFQSQPPGYRRLSLHWIVSAKRPETRTKRLATLIADSANELRLGALRRE